MSHPFPFFILFSVFSQHQGKYSRDILPTYTTGNKSNCLRVHFFERLLEEGKLRCMSAQFIARVKAVVRDRKMSCPERLAQPEHEGCGKKRIFSWRVLHISHSQSNWILPGQFSPCLRMYPRRDSGSRAIRIGLFPNPPQFKQNSKHEFCLRNVKTWQKLFWKSGWKKTPVWIGRFNCKQQ